MKTILSSIILTCLFCISTAALAATTGAEMHASKGVACQTCHNGDPTKTDLPTEANCTVCHQKEALIEKTKGIKPVNPHSAPHNNDCAACHKQHEKPVNYCAQCHSFTYNLK